MTLILLLNNFAINICVTISCQVCTLSRCRELVKKQGGNEEVRLNDNGTVRTVELSSNIQGGTYTNPHLGNSYTFCDDITWEIKVVPTRVGLWVERRSVGDKAIAVVEDMIRCSTVQGQQHGRDAMCAVTIRHATGDKIILLRLSGKITKTKKRRVGRCSKKYFPVCPRTASFRARCRLQRVANVTSSL